MTTLNTPPLRFQSNEMFGNNKYYCYQSLSLQKLILTALGVLYICTGFAEQSVTDETAITTISRKITYCVDPNWMPYEAIESGQHVGISSDYIKLVSEISGIEFQLLPTKDWKESLAKLQSGDCQLSPMLNFSRQRGEYLIFSDAYFESPNVLVSLKDQPFLQGFENIGKRRVALTQGYRIVEYVKANYPNIEFMLVANEQQGLQWVIEDKVDLFVGSMLSVNRHIFENDLLNLKIAGWAGPEDKLRFAIRKPDAYLIPEINEALENISEKQHIEIYKRWSNIRIVHNQNRSLAWQILIAAVIIIGVVIYRNRTISLFNQQLQVKNIELQRLRISMEQTNRELEFLSNHDPLTKLYNRNYFNKTVSEDLRNIKSGSVCLILVDIDHFKKINDTHGHKLGDEILKSLSTILNNVVREQDIVARWGGEEFVILCYQSSPEDAKSLCERLMKSIEQYHFPVVGHLTCSFGIAQLKSDESIMMCFERADKALYQAKDQGRDQICYIA